MVAILRNSLVFMQRPEQHFLILIAFIYNLYKYVTHIRLYCSSILIYKKKFSGNKTIFLFALSA